MADAIKMVGVAWDRLSTNTRLSLQSMSAEKWIRIVIVVCTYCLIRPYLLKFGGKQQMKQHEKEAQETEEARQKAQMTPNELRGHKIAGEIADDSDEEDGETKPQGQATGAEWGKKARKRQRAVIRKILDAEQKRLQDLQDDDEDKDIEQYLT